MNRGGQWGNTAERQAEIAECTRLDTAWAINDHNPKRIQGMRDGFQIVSIGVIRKTDNRIWMDIHPQYGTAMNGLEQYSHIHVLYWFHENDTPEQRQVLAVHPCRNPANPLTGVFATHSPMRPNLIALTLCHILSIDGLRIWLKDIDANDGTPVIDIKGYFPYEIQEEVRHPHWKRNS